MKRVQKIKFEARVKELLVLGLFIAITSFAIIEVKDLLNKEKIKALTEDFGSVTTGDQNILAQFGSQAVPLKVTGNAIAVLDIPAYQVRGQIVKGTDDETLKNYIGMFESSAEPGDFGNFCLAAHNNIYTELFRDLHKVRVGDSIRIVTKTEEFVYKVTSNITIDPTDTYVLRGSTKREITLITCTQAATKRICVKGELVSSRELTETEKEEGVK